MKDKIGIKDDVTVPLKESLIKRLKKDIEESEGQGKNKTDCR